MSFIYDTNPILEVMRQKTAATVESIKAAAPRREPVVQRRLDYTIQCLSAKRGGAFGHIDR